MGSPPPHRPATGTRRGALRSHEGGVQEFKLLLYLLFGLFNQLNPGGEGTGVGLALAKRVVEVHGGRMWVVSEGLGRGSAFWLTLPREGDDPQVTSSPQGAGALGDPAG